MTETKALQELQKDSGEALSCLIQSYNATVSTVIQSVLDGALSQEELEALCAEVFFVLWQEAPRLQPQALRGWLAGTARSLARDRFRAEGKPLPLDGELLHLDGLCPERELDQRVRRAVLLMQYPDREIFLRYYYYAQPLSHIALALSLEPAAVKAGLAQGRARLRDALSQEGSPRDLRISDLLDGLQEGTIRLEAEDHASPEAVLRLTQDKIKAEKKRLRRQGRGRRIRRVVLLTALALALAAGGYGLKSHPELIQKLAPATPSPEPISEPTPEPAAEPEASAPPFASVLGQSVRLRQYALSIEDVFLDANGIGTLTVRVENPEGHGFTATENGGLIQERASRLCLEIRTALGKRLESRCLPVEDSLSETALALRFYLAPTDTLNPAEELLLCFTLDTDGVTEEADIALPAAERLPVQRGYTEGLRVSYSPAGLLLRFLNSVRGSVIGDPGAAWSEDFQIDELTLSFADGEQYVLYGVGVDEAAFSTAKDVRHWIVFEQQIDVEQLTAIRVVGRQVIQTASSRNPVETRYSYTVPIS